jgi:hypothetical protein
MKLTPISFAILFTVALGMSACEEHKGPAERAGEKIDHAAGEVKQEAKEAKEDLKDAAHDAKKKVDD